MAAFNRGLDEAFVEALNEQYEKGKDGWWSQFVDDEDLFVAVRDNAVHVYYQGQRLIEVKWRDCKLAANTHYKHLLRPDMEPKYVDVVEDGELSVADTSRYFASRLNVKELKRAATVYAGDEKKGVHEILRNNPHILDVEIAISDGERGQIDFAALQEGKTGQAHIVFYEAKHFDNKEELRSEDGTADVIEQVNKYRSFLSDSHVSASLEECYRHVAKNLCALKGVAVQERHRKRHDLLQRNFTIEKDPWLVVFGFDGDQKSGRYWTKHRKKLEKDEDLKGKLILAGDAADVKIPPE